MIRNSTAVCALFLGIWAVTGLHGQDLDPQKVDFFETKIRPVLVEKCYECHSSKTPAGELGGKLRLDTSGGMLRGGTLGPLLQAGQAQSSLLIKVRRLYTSDASDA